MQPDKHVIFSCPITGRTEEKAGARKTIEISIFEYLGIINQLIKDHQKLKI